jgi:hypothetical protein
MTRRRNLVGQTLGVFGGQLALVRTPHINTQAAAEGNADVDQWRPGINRLPNQFAGEAVPSLRRGVRHCEHDCRGGSGG